METRICSRFLWLPKVIGWRCRWLVHATWMEALVPSVLTVDQVIWVASHWLDDDPPATGAAVVALRPSPIHPKFMAEALADNHWPLAPELRVRYQELMRSRIERKLLCP